MWGCEEIENGAKEGKLWLKLGLRYESWRWWL